MVVAKRLRGGRRNREMVFYDTEFQFCKMKSSGDWLHNNVSVCNIIELYT